MRGTDVDSKYVTDIDVEDMCGTDVGGKYVGGICVEGICAVQMWMVNMLAAYVWKVYVRYKCG